MGLWEFLTVIVIAGIIGEGYKHYVKAKERRPSGELEERIAQLDAENQDLHERIKALETIVTDEKYALDREIRSL